MPKEIGVGIALTTDPNMTRGLLEQFCFALQDATGLSVTPRGVWHYHRLLEQLNAGQTDVVWLPPVLALRATANGHVRPIALPVRNGESSYSAALFVRSDSSLQGPEDLKEVRVGWVDPQSAAGYLIMRAHLESQGVELQDAFEQELFLGSHDAVTEAVLEGRVDVGATFAYLGKDGRPKRAGWGETDMRLIVHAGPIPNDVVAARLGLPDLLVRLVQSALIDVQNAELREAARVLLAADGFVAPPEEHLAPLDRLLSGLQEVGDTPHSMFPRPLKPT